MNIIRDRNAEGRFNSMRVILSGYGNMGKMVEEVIQKHNGIKIAGKAEENNIHIFSEGRMADVIIDFSHPAMFEAVTDFAKRTGTALVCGTTGLSVQQKQYLCELGKTVPVVYSTNYSYGVAVLCKALTQLKSNLGDDWDMEITETHHNRKVDAPSGTALSMLACLDPDNQYERVYGRAGMCGKRDTKEIGIHSLRGGTEAGEHTAAFFGNGEIISITHRASSRHIFAEGAVRAAKKIIEKPKGFYTLDELLF